VKFEQEVRSATGETVKITFKRPAYLDYLNVTQQNVARARVSAVLEGEIRRLQEKGVSPSPPDGGQESVPAVPDGVQELTKALDEFAGKMEVLCKKREAANDPMVRSAASFTAQHIIAWDLKDDGEAVEPSEENVLAYYDVIGVRAFEALRARMGVRMDEAKNSERHSSGKGGIQTSPAAAGSAETGSQKPTEVD